MNNTRQSELSIKQLKGCTSRELLDTYAYRVTENIIDTIQGDVTNDPIAKQYIPQEAELNTRSEELIDPIGDEAHSPVKGIIHRYPDRVLFKPTSICAVYCRYCFHREQVGPKAGAAANILKEDEITAAINYIRAHPEIWEVIITGGDPLILSARQVGNIMVALEGISHVRVIRFHTRVPIADPKRITPALIKSLQSPTKAIYMALHVNHVQELNDAVRAAIDALHAAGINLLSQSVLLKNINDNAQTLTDLYRELVTLNVKPYYLHHPDLAKGTAHFRLSIAQGQNLMRELRGTLSGLCQPTYMLDIPEGYGKIPLTPCYIESLPTGGYDVCDYKGHTHQYAPESEKKKQ